MKGSGSGGPGMTALPEIPEGEITALHERLYESVAREAGPDRLWQHASQSEVRR